MTTETWISIGLGVLLLAVAFNAIVTLLLVRWYLAGVEMAEGIIDRASEDEG